MTVYVNLDFETDKRLTQLAKKLKCSKVSIAAEGIENYIENLESYYAADESDFNFDVVKDNKTPD